MNKILSMCIGLLMLVGCSSTSTDTLSPLTPDERQLAASIVAVTVDRAFIQMRTDRATAVIYAMDVAIALVDEADDTDLLTELLAELGLDMTRFLTPTEIDLLQNSLNVLVARIQRDQGMSPDTVVFLTPEVREALLVYLVTIKETAQYHLN